MSMTVIFSDFGDTDTQVLVNLWKDLPDVNLIHITSRTRNAKRKILQALVSEKDTLLFCGHGTSSGLFSPGFNDLLLGEHNVRYIRAQRVIGIWCHAAQFAELVNLKGFFSSMFISNIREANMMGCFGSSPAVITQQEVLFCNRINELIRNNTPMDQWVNLLRQQADTAIDVVKFNYSGLRYFS